MVHRLKMPVPLAGRRVQTQQRFRKQIGARPPSAIVVGARRARRHVQQSARVVDTHGPPDIRVAGDRPRVLLPRLVPKFPRLRNRIEDPHALPGPHIERLNRPGRIAFVLQAIGDAAPDNHQILVNDRGRGLSHLYLGVVVSQAFPQHRVAVLTKTGH